MYILNSTYNYMFLLSAQDRVITGTVKDADTKQPLAYCSVFFPQTSLGTTTDGTGKFKRLFLKK